MAARKIVSSCTARMSACAMIAIALCGCRIPFRPGLESDPDYDHLAENEQSSERPSRSRSPISRRLRPGSSPRSTDRYATTSDRPSKRNDKRSADALEEDAEYQEAYAAASPIERALLDRFGDALRNEPKRSKPTEDLAQAKKPTASRAARRTISDADDAGGYRFSDSEDDLNQASPPPVSQLASHPTTTEARKVERQEEAAVQTAGDIRPEDEKDSRIALASHKQPGDIHGASTEPNRNVDLASYELRELAHAMITRLEDADTSATNPDEKVDLAKKRRLINLVLDDIDAAQEPIEGLQDGAQDYVRDTFQGLHDAMDINGNPVASRRMTLALRSHRRAANNLSALANLEVLNVAFCTEVDSFGVVTKFPKYHFRPDQEVLLYCELENFVSESVKSGYQTQLQGSYEIVDTGGHRIADQLLPEDLDICGKKRRDFYIAYRLHMPEKIESGHHKLKLTVEDMKGHKFGQASIDFQIVR